jgi:hypothetical protein
MTSYEERLKQIEKTLDSPTAPLPITPNYTKTVGFPTSAPNPSLRVSGELMNPNVILKQNFNKIYFRIPSQSPFQAKKLAKKDPLLQVHLKKKICTLLCLNPQQMLHAPGINPLKHFFMIIISILKYS